MSFYRSLFGLYPHQHLVILPGADSPKGGYPVGQGVVKIHGLNVIDQRPEAWWKWIAAHEVGHMYWGFHVLDADRTSSDQLGWLTIGLGLYTDRLYAVAKGVGCQFHENRPKALEEARTAGKVVRLGLSEAEYGELDFDYNTVVRHGRAYCVVKQVAEIVGADPFAEILSDLQGDFANRELSYEGFRRFVEEKSGERLPSIVPELEG
ncbi:hypothetical protein ACFL6X_01215 [Candidatus Latescibacterota bacterium]